MEPANVIMSFLEVGKKLVEIQNEEQTKRNEEHMKKNEEINQMKSTIKKLNVLKLDKIRYMKNGYNDDEYADILIDIEKDIVDCEIELYNTMADQILQLQTKCLKM